MNALSNEQRAVQDDRSVAALAYDDVPFPELAHVREQIIELLARLDRPPQALRVQVGALVLDITWSEQKATARAGAAPPPHAPPDALPAAGDGQAADEGTAYLRSPAVGVFYHAREPGAEPFVSVGSVVQLGQQIGIVEAMKLMIPVEADRAGRITALVKDDGQPVEYDEPLFTIEPEEA
jgi:acetyl-CoA carboxylase biotin carboxyl carrier protein